MQQRRVFIRRICSIVGGFFVCDFSELVTTNKINLDPFITCYSDINFGGTFELFRPGTYIADQGGFGSLGNDSISSLSVPVGRCVDFFEHVDGSGDKITCQFGDYPWIGDDFNDKASLMIVYPWTDIYYSSDDPKVPSSFDNFINNGKYSNDQGKVSGSFSTKTNYFYKDVSIPLPKNTTYRIWEATKSGYAGWSYSVVNNVLKVQVWVGNRSFFGGRNWVGVRVSFE